MSSIKKKEKVKPKAKWEPRFNPDQFWNTINGMPKEGLRKMLLTYEISRDDNRAAGYPWEHIQQSIEAIRVELENRPIQDSTGMNFE